MIILDTCAILWLAQGSDRITPGTRALIRDEAIVVAPAICAFEIALKERAGKLVLPIPSREWWVRVVDHHHLDIATLTPETAIRATELPPIHRDPADRFIIALALERGAPVATADSRFADYGVTTLM